MSYGRMRVTGNNQVGIYVYQYINGDDPRIAKVARRSVVKTVRENY